MDKITYLNNKINQSKVCSNSKCQEEIKDGWFNTEICKNRQHFSFTSVHNEMPRRSQVKKRKM
jgi:hypothetical protein